MKKLGVAAIAMSCFIGFALIILGTWHSVQFERHCKGFLKRAADSNTIPLAQVEIGKAVRYLEEAKLTSGSTHVFYSTPECDLDFWYKNLNSSLKELESLPKDTDRLTASNQLLKLRETIMDNGEKGTRVTVPPNIHIFPNQFQYRVTGTICGFGFFGGLVAIGIADCDPKVASV